MKFSYNWLKDYIENDIPSPQQLAELLMFHSFEVEGLEKKDSDWILDIKVLPNRACDCLSHIGIAREIAAITNSKLRITNYELKENKNIRASDFIGVQVKDKKDCSRYAASVITNIKVGQSPKWLRERLEACGLQSINNIVDITNYVMLETGQPLHAFDADKIGVKSEFSIFNSSASLAIPGFQFSNKKQKSNSKFKKIKIIVRRARRGETIKTLDKEKAVIGLDEGILVIADNEKPIAIAGIKGGAETGIDESTRNIIIEAANFNPVVTRKASQKLKLRTDASSRFEQGIDPNLVDFAQRRAGSLIQQLAEGKVAGGLADFYPNKSLPKKIELGLDCVNQLLGIEIPKQTIVKILKSLGFELSQIKDRKIMVKVPTRRLDIAMQANLVEEIGRVYGYKNIPSVFPQTILIPPSVSRNFIWEGNIKNILKEAGLCEVYNYSFIGEEDKEIFGYCGNDLVEIENPSSAFNKYLRPSLLPNLLKNIKENFKWFPEIKIFELGRVFKRVAYEKSELPVLEKTMLSGLLATKGGGDEGFFGLKGIIEVLFERLGIGNIQYLDFEKDSANIKNNSLLERSKSWIGGKLAWHPGKSAKIKIKKESIGFLGEVNSEIGGDSGIQEQVFVFDLDFEKLLKFISDTKECKSLPLYPASFRDLAVLVPQGTKAAVVQETIKTVGGKMIAALDLFDVYQGKGIGQGKENLAFHIIYQVKDRTLTSKEVNDIHQKIIKALEENAGWEVRK